MAGEYYCSCVPLGFVKEQCVKPINGRMCPVFKPKKEYIKIINNIFNTFINNHDINSIASLRKVLISNNSIPRNFTTITLRNIILKPIYTGLMTIDKNIIYDNGQLLDESTDTKLNFFLDYFKPCVNVTPFVNAKTWFGTVSKLNSFPKTTRKKSIDTLFHNIVYCSHCNSILKLSSNYYRCSCKNTSISLNSLKLELLNYFNTSNITKDMLFQYMSLYKDSLNSEKSTLNMKIKQTRISLKNKIDILLDDGSEFDKLYKEEKTLTNSLIAVHGKICLLKTTKEDVTKLVNEICELNISNDNILKLFIEIFIEKVIIDGKNIIFNTKGTDKRSCSNLLKSFN